MVTKSGPGGGGADHANAPDAAGDRPPSTERGPVNEAVAAYKRILQEILVNRPSGTRQRLATALGKNRSFISQITLAAYPVPIPRRHLPTIFEICHVPEEDRRRFLDAYRRAHPRYAVTPETAGARTRAITLPDLGETWRNNRLDALVTEFIAGLARLMASDQPEPGEDADPDRGGDP